MSKVNMATMVLQQQDGTRAVQVTFTAPDSSIAGVLTIDGAACRVIASHLNKAADEAERSIILPAMLTLPDKAQ